MRKRTKRIISILCVCIMVCFVGTMGVSANNGNSLESYQLKALGRFECDVDKSGIAGDNPEDFVYDADDLYRMENLVKTGKTQLASSINAYTTGNVKTLDSFANLSAAVDTLTDFPVGTYYYDSTTGTDDAMALVRYKKENGSYFLCDQYGNKTSNTSQTVNISNLVEYQELDQENLTAGTAGMVDKSFVLGNGSDNISYRNSVKATLIQLSDTENKSFSIDIKEVCKDNNIDYTSLTKDNFLLNISSYSASIAATDFTGYGNGGHLPWGTYGGSSVITKTYDPATGIFTCNIPENWYTNTSGPWNLAAPGENFAYYYHYAKVVSSAKVIPYLVVY